MRPSCEALGSAVESGVSRTSDDAGEILGLSDRDVPGALETIASRRPNVIALERLFAATSRGAALINRLKMIEGTEARVLRLRQRVRIALSDEAGVIRFDAAVAWASFEMKTSTPGYRAGVAFTDARGAAVDAFCARHRRL